MRQIVKETIVRKNLKQKKFSKKIGKKNFVKTFMGKKLKNCQNILKKSEKFSKLL